MAKKKTEGVEVVANCDHLEVPAESRIITLRGIQVILDRDLAELYHVTTKRLNEQVRRNIKRFKSSYRFQLTAEETAEVIANCNRLQPLRFPQQPPMLLRNKVWRCYPQSFILMRQLK